MSEEKARNCALEVLRLYEFDIEDEELLIVKGSRLKWLQDKNVWVKISIKIDPPYEKFEAYSIGENGTNPNEFSEINLKDRTPEYKNHKDIQHLLSEMDRRLGKCVKK